MFANTNKKKVTVNTAEVQKLHNLSLKIYMPEFFSYKKKLAQQFLTMVNKVLFFAY